MRYALVLFAACRPAAMDAPPPPHDRADAIGGAAVHGSLRGEPFEARAARLDRDAAAVWLRIPGDGADVGRELRLGDASAWSVHYQRREGKRWLAGGRASAIVRIDRLARDGASGVLSACFAGAPASCVSGAFDAIACPDRLDPAYR